MKTYGLLALVFISLAGYVYFVEISAKSQEKQLSEGKKQILHLVDGEVINKIKISSGEVNSVLEKKDGTWHVTSPVEDLANRSVVDATLKYIAEAQGDVISSADYDPQVFGFSPEKGSIRLFTDKGNEYAFKVSTRKNFKNQPYLLSVKEKQLRIVEEKWGELATKKTADLRENRIFLLEPTDIEHVKLLRQGKKALEFGLSGAVWSLNEGFKSDSLEIERFVRDLRRPTIERYMAENVTSTKELAKYELASPEFEIHFKLKEGKEWNAKVSKVVNKGRYVKVGSRNSIYFIINNQFLAALKKKKIDFWDKNSPFNFADAEADAIDVQHDGKSIKIKKESDQWKVAGKPHSKAKELIDKLKEMKADKYSVGLGQEIKSPSSSIEIMSKGKSIYSIKWKKSKVKDMLDVKTDRFQYVVPVSSKAIKKLNLEAVFANNDKSEKKK